MKSFFCCRKDKKVFCFFIKFYNKHPVLIRAGLSHKKIEKCCGTHYRICGIPRARSRLVKVISGFSGSQISVIYILQCSEFLPLIVKVATVLEIRENEMG